MLWLAPVLVVYSTIGIFSYSGLNPMLFGWAAGLGMSLTMDILDALAKKEEK